MGGTLFVCPMHHLEVIPKITGLGNQLSVRVSLV